MHTASGIGLFREGRCRSGKSCRWGQAWTRAARAMRGIADGGEPVMGWWLLLAFALGVIVGHILAGAGGPPSGRPY